ncbi:hypothetical protein HD554DRAFT_2041436 [Boletus coccyginus]|nr:hypothetical protein HD554DRAFT_2041436 [Boletus coccyginus]
MDFLPAFQLPGASPSEADVGDHDQDAPGGPGPAFLMHFTLMNTIIMAEFFHELVDNLPSVFDTLQESPANETAVFDNAVPMPTVCDNSVDFQANVAEGAMRFANSHPKFGMNGWVLLYNRLTLNYIARIGMESLQAFCQQRSDDIEGFILSEYEEVAHEGGVPPEDDKLLFYRLVLIHGRSVWACINVLEFLCVLVQMARHTMALALYNTPSLNDGNPNSPLTNTFFGIYDCVHTDDGALQFRLLETSSTHTTNLVSSMVILVLQTCYLCNRQFPTLSECKMSELKVIYDSNKESFCDVVACSQVDVPKSMQVLACVNLLNILPTSHTL